MLARGVRLAMAVALVTYMVDRSPQLVLPRRVGLPRRPQHRFARRPVAARTTSTGRPCRSSSTGCCGGCSGCAPTCRTSPGRRAAPDRGARCSGWSCAGPACTLGWRPPAAGLFLFLGSGYQNIVWAFQIGFVGSLVFGLAHLLLIDHDGGFDRRDALGLAFGLAGLMCSGVSRHHGRDGRRWRCSPAGLAHRARAHGAARRRLRRRGGWPTGSDSLRRHAPALGLRPPSTSWSRADPRDALGRLFRPARRGADRRAGGRRRARPRDDGGRTRSAVGAVPSHWWADRSSSSPIAGMGRAGYFGVDAATDQPLRPPGDGHAPPGDRPRRPRPSRARWRGALPVLAVLLLVGVPGNLAELHGDDLNLRLLKGNPALREDARGRRRGRQGPGPHPTRPRPLPGHDHRVAPRRATGRAASRTPTDVDAAGVQRRPHPACPRAGLGHLQPTGCEALDRPRAPRARDRGDRFRIVGGDIAVRVTYEGRTGVETIYARPNISSLVARADLVATVEPFRPARAAQPVRVRVACTDRGA